MQRIGRQQVELESGEFVFGRKKASSELDMPESTVWDYMKMLEEDEVITIKSNNRFSVVSVANWGFYQSEEELSNNKPTTDGQQMDNSSTTDEQQMDTNKNVKNLRIKEPNTTTAKNDAIVFYQNNIGMIRPNIAEEILDYINDFGDEVVIESLNRSIARNKPNWGYARSILNSWHNKNIKTMEQIQAEDVEFQNQQKQRFNNYKPKQKEEQLPDWYEKHKNEVAEAERRKELERKKNENLNEEEVAKELDDLINSVKRGG